MITPPYLQPGDTIGIVCPAGYMPVEKVQTCIDVLQQWGYKVVVGKTVGSQFNYFSGTDNERLQDLQQMLDDAHIKAILCGRGGYGLSRIIDQIDFRKFKLAPKWVIGYSDVTVLLAHLFNQMQTASFHSPMAAAFSNNGFQNQYVQSLQKRLSGQKFHYTCAPHLFNSPGTAHGTLVGGNLSILAHLIGTPSDIDTRGKILFVEDVGEYIYNVDRMFYQLKRSGKLHGLAGLIIGQFTEMKDTVVPFGQNTYQTIAQLLREFSFPVCYGFPVGHTDENYVLKVGAECMMHITESMVTLHEI